MDLKDFKSGNYIQKSNYQCFNPSPINVAWTWTDAKIYVLLAEAYLKLGELNAFPPTCRTSILKLKEKIEGGKIVRLGKRRPRAKQLVNHLYKNPFITAADVERQLDVTPATANALIAEFVALGILGRAWPRYSNNEARYSDRTQIRRVAICIREFQP